MKGYHATLKENGISIIENRAISLTGGDNSIYGTGNGIYNTTAGYVYLATTIEKAFDFGLRAWGNRYIQDKNLEKEIYLFEVELKNQEEILVDKDEAELECVDINLSKEDIIRITQSYRVPNELRFNKEIYRYAVIKFINLKQGYDSIDSGTFNQLVKWNKVNLY